MRDKLPGIGQDQFGGYMKSSIGRVFSIIALCCFAVSLSYAADWATVRKDAEAKSAAFEKAITDMTFVQETTMKGPAGSVPQEITIFKKGPKIRTESIMNMPGMTAGKGMQNILIYDGKETWISSPMMGKRKLEGNQNKPSGEMNDWYKMVSDKTEVTGEENVGGRDCYVLKVESNNNLPFTKIWIDKKTFAMLQGESTMPNSAIAKWTSSDFKPIAGDLEMPFKTEMYIGKDLVSSSAIKSFKVNSGLSDDLFNPESLPSKTVSMEEMMKNMPAAPQGAYTNKQ